MTGYDMQRGKKYDTEGPSALLFSLLLSIERVSSKYPFDYCAHACREGILLLR
jgi:hypothetical protein